MQMQLAFRGETKNLRQWADHMGTSPGRLKLRIVRIGKEAALSEYVPRRGTTPGFVDASTPYVQDRRCQRLVKHFVGGMTLDEVGEVMGEVSRERIRQIENIAVAKMRLGLQLEQLVGIARAERILTRLRGKQLHAYQSAVTAAAARGR